jgi:Rieske Fe-S protein
MSDTQDPAEGGPSEDVTSIEQVVRLDAFLDQLLADRRPTARDLTIREQQEYLLGVQMRLLREGVEIPRAAYLLALQDLDSAGALSSRHRRRIDISRNRLFWAAGGALAAGFTGAGMFAYQERQSQPLAQGLLAGHGRWYDIAALNELAQGQSKGFAAGGILGYLINDHHHLVAVSAICTHLGCRLKATQAPLGLRCPCHGSRFSADGAVLAGPASIPLPHIALYIKGARIYVLGTIEDLGTA